MTLTLPTGLYRTTSALPGREAQVPAGALIFYQARGEGEPPVALLPGHNVYNRWRFRRRGYAVRDAGWPRTLEPLLWEGYYLTFGEVEGLGGPLPEGTLVQLGYNRAGEPIIFESKFIENSIQFSERGRRAADLRVLERLIPAGFGVVGALLEAP